MQIYSADNKLIAEYGEQKRHPLRYEQIPPDFTNALLATEDNNFFHHHGVNFTGLARAAFQLITTGKKKSGGSTITMQVAKNYYLTREKTFTRKFTEILLALEIERNLSKEEILTLYINKIYLGQRAYGIEAAARVYYGKPIGELELPQLAMIAGLPQAPSAANPLSNKTRAFKRRNHVLKRMLKLNHISQEQYQAAIDTPLSASHHRSKPELYAPYVADMARSALLERYPDDAYTHGYKVYTSINSQLQKTANIAVQKGLLEYNRKHGFKGAKHNFPLEAPKNDDNAESLATTEETIALEEAPLPYSDSWLPALKQQPTYGILQPALVQQVNDRDIFVLLKNNESKNIDWPGLSWASPYKSINSKGKKPRTASDIVKQGDLVWVYADTNANWQLSQVPEAQSALISLNPQDGAIQSLIGGFDFVQSHFNRVTQAERQPGSSFKPFIYSAALDNRLTPASIINDAPVVFEDNSLENMWRPENDGGRFYGPTRLRKALYRSRNLVSIRILRQMGLKSALQHLQPFGFETEKLNRDLSLALGGSAMTPMTLATAYATFANGGFKVDNYLIDRITDSKNNTLFQHQPLVACTDCQTQPATEETSAETIAVDLNFIDTPANTTETHAEIEEEKPQSFHAPRVLEAGNAFLINSILQDVIQKGTGRRARALKRSDIAGKTGTTNEQKDAWFAGFNADYVTVVWVGFDQPSTLGRNAYGGNTALPIWMDFMREALKDKPYNSMKMPSGMVTVRIDPTTGLRARPGQADAIFETFRQGNEPQEYAEIETQVDEADELTPEQLF